LAAVRAALARHQSAGREAKREAVRAALAAALKPPAPQKLDAAYDPAAHGGSVGSYPRGYKVIPPAQLEAAKAVYDPATAFVEGVTAGIDGAKVAFGTDARGRAWASERGMRGHTRAPEGADYVAVLGGVPEADDAAGRRREIETAVHELGHVVEFHKPAVRELAKQFLDHRCGDEPVKKLTDLFPAANYGDDEVGRRDGFAKVFGADAYYVGKHYGSGSTEVVSMGLEQLYRDPAKFAEKDPEYFAFVCHVLTM
jgi:hypothetical protein